MTLWNNSGLREVQIRTGQRTANEFRMEDGLDEYEGGELFFVGGGMRPVRDIIQEPEETETIENGLE